MYLTRIPKKKSGILNNMRMLPNNKSRWKDHLICITLEVD